MSDLPTIPFSHVRHMEKWANFHGTIGPRSVPVHVTPDLFKETTATTNLPRKLRRCSDAITAVLEYCRSHGFRLRTTGARWSMSDIIEPEEVILDPGYMNVVLRVAPSSLTKRYRVDRGAQGFVPIFAQGGTHISSLNRRLADIGLALRTTGASDGHRVAGCVATGTHGSAIEVGAVHDTVLGVHLVTAPGTSVFVQAKSNQVVSAEFTKWLSAECGIPVTLMNSDELFAAATVSLGSLGVVHGLVLEATPNYVLARRVVHAEWSDAALIDAVTTLNTGGLHPDRASRPYHFAVVVEPYARSGGWRTAYVELMWQEPLVGDPPPHPLPGVPSQSSDVMDVIGGLSDALDGAIGNAIIKRVIRGQMAKRYQAGDRATQPPSHVFGPSNLAAGEGTSIELAVDQKNALMTAETIFAVLTQQAKRGRLHLGPIALRFVPAGRALLGLNIHPVTCYFELPAIRTAEAKVIYSAIWDALDAKGIPYGTHWGQIDAMTPARLTCYFGDRVERWRSARNKLVEDVKMRDVFEAPLLRRVGIA